MKPNDRDKAILEYIVKHCNRINKDMEIHGSTYQAFLSNDTFRDSVSMNLLQIGELVGHLSEDLKTNTQSQIPWKQIRAMRNLFAHDYNNMSTEKIWVTASTDVPTLAFFCENQISLLEQGQSKSLSSDVRDNPEVIAKKSELLNETYEILKANPQLKRRFDELSAEYSKKYGVSVSDTNLDTEKRFKINNEIICSDPIFKADYIKARDEFRSNKQNIEQDSQTFPKVTPPKHSRR